MTDRTLIPGKRYRFTGEGIADDDGDGIYAGDYYLPYVAHAEPITFDLIPDPLPTTLGSHIYTPATDAHYILGHSDRSGLDYWYANDGDVLTNDEMTRLDWTLIYTA